MIREQAVSQLIIDPLYDPTTYIHKQAYKVGQPNGISECVSGKKRSDTSICNLKFA